MNMKKKENQSGKGKTGRESLMSSCTLSYFPTANVDNIKEGKETFNPPPTLKL